MSRTILRVVVVAAIACAALAALLPWEPLRLVAALPLLFFLPGYAIVAASFGRRPPEWPDLVVLSLGCSLSVAALGGLVLSPLPGGIETASWAILLAAVTVIASAIAGRRDFASTWKSVRRPRVRPGDAVFVLVALVLAAGAVVLANKPLGAESAGRFTALWMLPPADAAGDTVTIGVESAEKTRRGYELKVETGGGRAVSSAASCCGQGASGSFRFR